MKTLLSLILPENSVFRYLKNGRKGIGFNGGALVTRNADGTEVGVAELAAADVASTITGTTGTVTKRLTLCTSTSAVTLTLPPVAGSLRDVIVIKQGANKCAVTKVSTDASNIVVSGAGSADSSDVATASHGRFLSDGTKWYRVA
jgi:hypothetical protein